MFCRICNSWFHLQNECPYRNCINRNYVQNDGMTYEVVEPYTIDSHPEFPDSYSNSEFDPSLLNSTSAPEQAYFSNSNPDSTTTSDKPLENLYINLCYNIQIELLNPQNQFHFTEQPASTPNPPISALVKKHIIDIILEFKGFCMDEGAPYSVTGLKQWLDYVKTYNIPNEFYTILHNSTSLAFGGKGKEKVSCQSLGIVKIRVPLPDATFFDYRSLIILNDVPMLLGLQTQTRLRTITDKYTSNLRINLRSLNIKLPVVIKDNHLYYEGPSRGEILFSSAELAQIHRKLGHAPVGASYSALRRAYPIETDATDLKSLKKSPLIVRDVNYTQSSPKDTVLYYHINVHLTTTLK